MNASNLFLNMSLCLRSGRAPFPLQSDLCFWSPEKYMRLVHLIMYTGNCSKAWCWLSHLMENSYCLFLTYPVGLGTSRQDQHVKAIWVPYCHLKLVWSAIKPVSSSSSVCVCVCVRTHTTKSSTNTWHPYFCQEPDSSHLSGLNSYVSSHSDIAFRQSTHKSYIFLTGSLPVPCHLPSPSFHA